MSHEGQNECPVCYEPFTSDANKSGTWSCGEAGCTAKLHADCYRKSVDRIRSMILPDGEHLLSERDEAFQYRCVQCRAVKEQKLDAFKIYQDEEDEEEEGPTIPSNDDGQDPDWIDEEEEEFFATCMDPPTSSLWHRSSDLGTKSEDSTRLLKRLYSQIGTGTGTSKKNL